MLRISVASPSPAQTVLKLEGRMGRDQVPLLERELQVRSGQQLSLDLEGVTFLDSAGLDFLARWHQAGGAAAGRLALRQDLVAGPGAGRRAGPVPPMTWANHIPPSRGRGADRGSLHDLGAGQGGAEVVGWGGSSYGVVQVPARTCTFSTSNAWPLLRA